ncbi:HNH endonuclease [Phocaeicola fibrisolvens]|uniref:HNH endonuclease n=1 Tax=Phocaeicola fibrisolvens TaxID=2981793 RepID=UPI0021D0A578|nr:HNH endonuclease [Phocaeicola fibrisolvens]MCU6777335.1 HNH endonuclease [Phocaeicola fibrisolvens]
MICGARYPLEVHHKTYKINGVSIVGKELEHLDCLVTLCASCHEKVHKGIIRL